MATIALTPTTFKRASLPWSLEQKAIFSLIQNGTENVSIEACAGGAKTTTIIEAINYIPAGKRAIFVAFNKSIADTLASKIPDCAVAATLHSVANTAIKQLGWSKVNGRKTSNILQYELIQESDEEQKTWFWENQKQICAAIAIAKGSLGEYSKEQLTEAVVERGVEPSYFLDSFLYPLYLKSLDFKAGEKGRCVIDFEDMLRIPLLEECTFPTYDFVFVDEAQDLNDVQRLICERLLAAGGRLIAVGDRKQAIYGFRGASYNSFDLITEHFSCKTMPLDVSYRCGQAVVGEANKLYEDIYALPTAQQGSVGIMPDHSLCKVAKGGDMVLCRVNWPLVSQAMMCVAQGKPVCILSSDLPENILKYSKQCIKWGKKYYNNQTDEVHPELLTKYFDSILIDPKLTKGRRAFLTDLRDTILFLLAPNGNGVANLSNRLEEMFCPTFPTVPDKYILFSSIHRAKGLESDRVFILEPQFLPHYLAETTEELTQEKNLHYVAITRSKKDLVYVVPAGEERLPLSFNYKNCNMYEEVPYTYSLYKQGEEK